MNSSRPEITELTLSDGSSLQAKNFGSFILLRESAESNGQLAGIGNAIFDRQFDFIDEVIATEVEICLAINESFESGMLREIEQLNVGRMNDSASKQHTLSIWFPEEADDWKHVTQHSGLAEETYIDQLLDCELTVAMIGFLPGFAYLKGLPDSLHVPRKERPSTRNSVGSFAIGGKYAGVYALPSAAGWHCIGRIAESLLNTQQLPPLTVAQGDRIKLKRIDEKTFRQMWKPKRESPCRKRFPVFDDGRGSLFFETPGMLTLIQDAGRPGLAFYAIPPAGAMDVRSAEVANALLRNLPRAPVIECHFVPPSIRFESDATICLTGADMGWSIDGSRVKRNRTIDISKGSTLHGSAAIEGCRGYIAIHGEIDTEQTFDSAACYTPAHFGGNLGKPFAARDELQWIKPETPAYPLQINLSSSVSASEHLQLVCGPEFDWLDNQSKELLFSGSFSVSSQSNRMGARLNGPLLKKATNRLLSDSVPLLPGMIQLTPEGQCIVVLQDGQTTGGYPRIAYLPSISVQRLNQTRLGHPFQFELQSLSEA